MSFVHLHVHSQFSFARGADTLDRLCRAVRERGMDTLAVTDTNGLYGLIWFVQFARAAGVRPIVGAELRWGAESAIVLVRDAQGYAGLCGVLTELHRCLGPTVGSEGDPRRASDESDEHWEQGSSDSHETTGAREPPSGTPGRRAANCERRSRTSPFHLAEAVAALAGVVVLSSSERLLARIARERGARDLYAEFHPALDARRRASLREVVRRHGIPPVATGAVHFADPSGHATHRLLRAVAANSVLASPGEPDPPGTVPPGCWLRPGDRMAALHPDLPEAIAATERIADACRFEPELGRPIFPEYPTSDGRDAAELLESRCREGIGRRYGATTEAVEERLRRELSVIRDKGFAPYFLVVHDIVSQAPRTCGRGSAAASLVSYLLGITQVDPIRHDLYFDRFLNPGRTDPPDIDVDFPWDERDGVLDWTFEHFGRRSTAMIANHSTFGPRAAVREVAKVFGLPDGEIGRVSKRIPWHADDPVEAVRTHPVFRGLDLCEPWPEILSLARTIHGAPRHLSVHPGGVVIVPQGVDRIVPVQPAPKGVPVIQWEKDQAEDAGLVKIDLLGNRSLAVIRDACREAAAHGAEPVSFHRFDPTGDPAARDLIRRGDTMGVFYAESPAMRQLQAKCDRGDYEHLVIHSSIIRPAANDYIQEYIRRLKGGAWEPLHPLLADVLSEAYGVMVYQEDVSRTAIAMGGFDVVSADDLRRVLSKKHKAAKLADYGQRFVAGARERGVPDDVIAQVWHQILSFGGYSFCKPHSASYAMVSFQSAWLRAHHPAEFMAAVISNQGGYYSAFAYVSECRRMGLTLLPPSVNESERAWTGQGREVRVGLMQLQRFPSAVLDALLAARVADGPFRSLDDLVDRLGTEARPEAVRALVLSGACDCLLEGGASRADLVWRLTARTRPRERERRTTGRLFPDEREEREAAEPPRLPRAGDYDARTLLEHEVDTLGFLISRHPLTLWSAAIRRSGAVPARDLGRHTGRRVRTVGWYVTGKPVLIKRGEPMEFLSFEDTTALYETTFFPEAYARFCSQISRSRPYLLEGKVEENYGVVTLTVDGVRRLTGHQIAA